MVHHGLVEHVENLDRNRTYGKQTQGSENINGVIKAQNLVGMSEKFNSIKEAKYQSHKREPLGQGLTRDYQMPVQTKNPDFRFGVSSSQCDNAKDLIAPQGGAMEEKPEFAKMYAKTHSNIQAGV